MERMTAAKVLIIQEESMDGVLVCVRCSLPQQSSFPQEVRRYIAVECYHSDIRPVLLQKKRQYLEGNIWFIFLSVVQISTKYCLCSKKIKYRLIVLTGRLGTIGTMRTLCQPWRQMALAPTMASGTLTPQPSV